MKGSTLAFILLRLAAIFFVYQATMLLPTLVSVTVGWSSTNGYSLVLWTGMFAFYLALFFILWFGAKKIGRRVAGESQDETEIVAVSAQEFLQAGIILIGVYVVVFTVPSVFGGIANSVLNGASSVGGLFDFLTRNAIMLVMGFGLILYPNKLVGMMQRVRRAGTP